MATKSVEERAAERYENPQEPYCFETDREQQWYRCGECDGYIAGATDQDRIARQEERERCIKVAQDVTCRMCESSCREEKKYLCPLYSAIRYDIMKGGEG